MGLISRLATIVSACAALNLAYAASSNDDPARRLVSLVDYIGGDYGEAVAGGKVIDAAEYAEMQDFARSSMQEFNKVSASLPAETQLEMQANLSALAGLIEQKADIAAIRALTTAIKNRLIDGVAMVTAPQQTPNKQIATAKYQELCAGCHGASGAGDGPQSTGMVPPPRNFHDQAVLDVSSPFKFFNALVLGIEGTPMVSYASALSEQERWSLAFYVSGIAKEQNNTLAPEAQWQNLHPTTRQSLEQAGLSLALLSRKSDLELKQWLTSVKGLEPQQIEPILSVLRTAAPYLATTPRETTVVASSATPAPQAELKSDLYQTQIEKVRSYLQDARAAYARSDRDAADALLLDGYLVGFEKLEGPLGLKHPEIVTQVEQAFIAARKAARDGETKAFEQQLQNITTSLDTTQRVLSEPSSSAVGSLAADFAASLVIILREGFEAFLVIGALLALLRKSGADRVAFRVLHAGWVSAIVAGLASYYLFMSVFALTGATRETIEAVCTGTAAIMLFYVSFWLLNQAERGRWDGLVRNFANAATANSKLTMLFGVAFIAVYREAAETVLFYAALASSATSTWAVGAGFVAGTTLLFAVVWGIIHWGVRIPIKRFFLMTSSAMIGLSLILAGKAMNELVEAGYISPTTISPFPTIDLLGIYPHWESVAVQVIAALAAAILAYRQAAIAKQVRR